MEHQSGFDYDKYIEDYQRFNRDYQRYAKDYKFFSFALDQYQLALDHLFFAWAVSTGGLILMLTRTLFFPDLEFVTTILPLVILGLVFLSMYFMVRSRQYLVKVAQEHKRQK